MRIHDDVQWMTTCSDCEAVHQYSHLSGLPQKDAMMHTYFSHSSLLCLKIRKTENPSGFNIHPLPFYIQQQHRALMTIFTLALHYILHFIRYIIRSSGKMGEIGNIKNKLSKGLKSKMWCILFLVKTGKLLMHLGSFLHLHTWSYKQSPNIFF